MNFEEAKRTLLETGSLTLLTRQVGFDCNGKIISDVIIDHIHGHTYPTPKPKKSD